MFFLELILLIPNPAPLHLSFSSISTPLWHSRFSTVRPLPQGKSLSASGSLSSEIARLVSATSYMPTPRKTIAIVNGTGRQAASVIRAVAAVGYAVRAQVYSSEGLVAEELAELPNVTLFEGPLLDNPVLIDIIFDGAQIAFVNTNPLAGDEIKMGKALANAAKKRNIQHFIYSSMPDHSIHNVKWPSLPQWACKFTVENYIRQLSLPSTFVYAGVYYNNFTSLPYPLFCTEFKDDGTVEWRAPFHPHAKLPWLDAEHDFGPAVLQIVKDGPSKWGKGQR